MDGLSGVIWQTTDAGQSWHQASYPLGLPAVDATSCASPTFCVAAGELLLVSRDGGASWQTQTVTGGMHGLTSISCPTSSHCIALGANSAGTIDGALAGFAVVTNDGGATWQELTMPTGSWNLGEVACLSSATCLATGPALTSNAALPFDLSQDGGASWTAASPPTGFRELMSVACATPTSCVGVGASPSGPATAVTADGLTWTVPPSGVSS